MACVRTSFPVKKFVTMHLCKRKEPQDELQISHLWAMDGWVGILLESHVCTDICTESSAIFIYFGGHTWHFFFFASSWFPVCCHLLMSLSQSVNVNFEESTFNSMLAWAKTIIHPSVHNHLLPVIHRFLNKWKVSFKTYEHLLYLRTNVCPFSSC